MGHTGAYIINSFFTGSSPPMLGIPLSAPGGDLSKWFIPTYVGHTAAPGLRWTARPVHPHIRGAYQKQYCRGGSRNGSSPHTWGIPFAGRTAQSGARFIPTYVGHTTSAPAAKPSNRVHPHIRGAYFFRNYTQPHQPVHPHIRGAYLTNNC